MINFLGVPFGSWNAHTIFQPLKPLEKLLWVEVYMYSYFFTFSIAICAEIPPNIRICMCVIEAAWKGWDLVVSQLHDMTQNIVFFPCNIIISLYSVHLVSDLWLTRDPLSCKHCYSPATVCGRTRFPPWWNRPECEQLCRLAAALLFYTRTHGVVES